MLTLATSIANSGRRFSYLIAARYNKGGRAVCSVPENERDQSPLHDAIVAWEDKRGSILGVI